MRHSAVDFIQSFGALTTTVEMRRTNMHPLGGLVAEATRTASYKAPLAFARHRRYVVGVVGPFAHRTVHRNRLPINTVDRTRLRAVEELEWQRATF